MEGLKKGLAAEPGKAELVGTVPYEITERALGTHALKMKETGGADGDDLYDPDAWCSHTQRDA